MLSKMLSRNDECHISMSIDIALSRLKVLIKYVGLPTAFVLFENIQWYWYQAPTLILLYPIKI